MLDAAQYFTQNITGKPEEKYPPFSFLYSKSRDSGVMEGCE